MTQLRFIVRLMVSAHHVHFLCSYNVGCTKRMGLFPNRKTTLENMKKQRALNGNHKNCSLESKKKVRLFMSDVILCKVKDNKTAPLLYLTFYMIYVCCV